MRQASNAPDFDVQQHIAVAFLRPDTEEARALCDEHLVTEDALTWGRASVVEPRHLEDILRSIVRAGLTVRLCG